MERRVGEAVTPTPSSGNAKRSSEHSNRRPGVGQQAATIEDTAIARRPGSRPVYVAAFILMAAMWANSFAVTLALISLGGSALDVGIVASLRFALGAVLSLPAGTFADAWGVRRSLTLAAAIACVVHTIPLLALAWDSLVPLYVWGFASGVAMSLLLPASSAYVASVADANTRGRAFGWYSFSTNTGVAAGPALAGIGVHAVGLAGVHAGVALVSLLSVAVLRLVSDFRAAVPPSTDPVTRRLEVARDPGVLGVWLSALAIGVAMGAGVSLLPVHGIEVGLSAGALGIVLGVQAVVNALSRLPLGILIDRTAFPLWTIGVAAMLTALAMAGIGTQQSVIGLALLMGGGALSLSYGVVLGHVVIAERATGSSRAAALGGSAAALATGFAIGSVIAGWFADRIGSEAGFFGAGAVSASIALVTFGFLWSQQVTRIRFDDGL